MVKVMALPAELVLVRHGESEGNFVKEAAKRGDTHHWSEEFAARRGPNLRLTLRGIAQAKAAGAWIREHIGERFDRYYTTFYDRAKETAGHLGLPDASWRVSAWLHERDWGEFDNLSPEELMSERVRRRLAGRKQAPLFWRPPGGESLIEVALRFDRLVQTLYRECDGGRVILVIHGEVMAAARVVLERMDVPEFNEWMRSTAPEDDIDNCQIFHYTRRIDPEDPGSDLARSLQWRRSVCPWDPARPSRSWERIQRPRFSNEELLEAVEAHPRLIDGPPPRELSGNLS